ncbi:MAG TPA: hypothetical protein VIF10_05725 [Methylobacter sp.]|jgi:hypothetical protein
MKLIAITVAIAALILVGVFVLKGKSAKDAQPNTAGFPPDVAARIEEERAARQEVQTTDPQFFAAVSKVMFEHDPIAINFGTNTDEYDPEAGTVIPRLQTCTSADDVVTVVHEEFQRWFGKDDAGDRGRYIKLANDIWALWQQRG